jgi:hypothetical protein
MPISLLKTLTEKQNSDKSSILEEKSANTLEKLGDKVVSSPKLKKGEARSAALCLLNEFYAPFVNNLLKLENYEGGEATKDALAGLDKMAKAISGLSNREREHHLLGFLNKG